MAGHGDAPVGSLGSNHGPKNERSASGTIDQPGLASQGGEFLALNDDVELPERNQLPGWLPGIFGQTESRE
jgi:hypothetical protein